MDQTRPPHQPGAAQAVSDYVHAVRTRWTDPIAPPGFVPDWADRPAPHTYYPQTERLPLPLHTVSATTPRGGYDMPLLGSFLQLSAGVLSRRWEIDRSPDRARTETVTGARWGRGTPSGGGAYPLELYLAAGPSAPVPAGIHHYASGLHALEQVASGDPVPRVRSALHTPTDGQDGGFLLCVLRFWKSAYKYNNFAYHLMLHDLGAFLGSWDLLCREHGTEGDPRLDFDDAALSRLVGQEPGEGGVLAVLPLPWAEHGAGARGQGPLAAAPPREPGPARPVRLSPYGRSRRTREFPMVTAVHRATSTTGGGGPCSLAEPPEAVAVGSVAAEVLPLPALTPAPADRTRPAPLADSLARRVSANGRFNGVRPVELSALGELLAAAAQGRPPEVFRGSTRIRLAAHRVTGLAPGVYDYLPGRHALAPVPVDVPNLDERVYALSNYSVGQAAVTLVPHWHPERTVARAGPRAYRYAAVAAGASAQRIQVAATGAGLASGIVLGFQGPVLEAALGLDADGRHALLCVFLGHRQEGEARLDDRLY
ncbi:nitroreductase family protein [Streptomyces sp. NPDC008086]|uniref:nitroreductase family protein n=1 Tax=Streptomyces sp. NPDC008086 TaxID=3364807 RepID=UPI0036E1E54F